MCTNDETKSKRELAVFARFISISALPIDPEAVESRKPPEPDILCQHATDGSVAFELTELINHDFVQRLRNQESLQRELELAHEKLPENIKQSFDQQFANANLYFSFQAKATLKKVQKHLPDVFIELSQLLFEFTGRVDCFESKFVAKIIKSVSISRGGFNGPAFSVENIGGVGDSVVPKIEDKIRKAYHSRHPIELLGYLDLAGTLPSKLWEAPADRFFASLTDLGPFRKIWIVDIRNESIARVYAAN